MRDVIPIKLVKPVAIFLLGVSDTVSDKNSHIFKIFLNFLHAGACTHLLVFASWTQRIALVFGCVISVIIILLKTLAVLF